MVLPPVKVEFLFNRVLPFSFMVAHEFGFFRSDVKRRAYLVMLVDLFLSFYERVSQFSYDFCYVNGLLSFRCSFVLNLVFWGGLVLVDELGERHAEDYAHNQYD